MNVVVWLVPCDLVQWIFRLWHWWCDILAQRRSRTLVLVSGKRQLQPYKPEQDPLVKGPPPPPGQIQVLAPDLISNGEGIDNGGHPSGLIRPPDPDIAVGPNYILTVVNSTFVIYNKSEVELQRTSLAVWFNTVCSGCSPFDLRVAYDPQAGRFIRIVLAKSTTNQTSNYLLSISQSSNPTGAWWNYSLNGRLDYTFQVCRGREGH